MPTLPDPDSVRGIAHATGAGTREILSRVTTLIQAHGYDAVILEDDRERPANALLHRRYADALRTAYDLPPAEVPRAVIEGAGKPTPFNPDPEPIPAMQEWHKALQAEAEHRGCTVQEIADEHLSSGGPIRARAIDPSLVRYNTWRQLMGTDAPEDTVVKAVEDYKAAAPFEPQIDHARVCRDYRKAIGMYMPEGVVLIDCQFYGPPDQEFHGRLQLSDGSLDIRGIIEFIDLDIIIRRHTITDPA